MNSKNTNRTHLVIHLKKFIILLPLEQMIKQPGILITRNTFHINDTRRFKSVHFQDIKSNFVSQAITETPRAMSKKYTRISKSHIVKRIVEKKLHSTIFVENYSPIVSSFENFHILDMFTSLKSTRE